MFLNTLLKVALHTGSSTTSISSPVALGGNTVAADSVIACADKCGFTAADVALVQEWKAKNADVLAQQAKNVPATANDVATTIPYIVLGVPLFWFHFAKIRKETPSTPVSPVQTV
jgi:hypothetical protein